MGNVRSCVASYRDGDFKKSIEVVAETLYEAVALGIKAMNVPRDRLHVLSFDVSVKSPEVWHSISGSSLSAWLGQHGKSPKEQALKARLADLVRG
jgi:hypothetical protein